MHLGIKPVSVLFKPGRLTVALCRQCVIDPSFIDPINFDYNNKRSDKEPSETLKYLLNLLKYKSVNKVYQLYSQNSRSRPIHLDVV